MDKLLDVLGTVYKIPLEDAESLKKPDGTLDEEKLSELIIQKDRERIAEVKKEYKVRFDQGYQKGQKETSSGRESKLKEKFDIESDLQGDELLDYIAETLKIKSTEVKKMTDDDIKSHPLFMQTLKDHKKQLTEKDSERETAVKKLQDDFSQKEIFSEVEKGALDKLKKIGEIILPNDPEKARKTVDRLLIAELRDSQWLKKDGKYFPLDKEGKILQDEHGYALELDEYVEKIAKSNFEFKVATNRSSPNNNHDQPPTKDQPKKKYTGKVPSDQKEYLSMLVDDKLTGEQKLEIKSEYGGRFSKN